jgi:hypothetical protein
MRLKLPRAEGKAGTIPAARPGPENGQAAVEVPAQTNNSTGGTAMTQPLRLGSLAILLGALLPSTGLAFGVGHHGGIILDCTAPIFFEEAPGKDAKVPVFQKFSFTASENTDPSTLKVWVNAKPVPFTVSEQRSGRLSVEAALPEPIAQGRAWIKVTGISHDGCDQLHTWNVYAGE